jgi:hypothetical protein
MKYLLAISASVAAGFVFGVALINLAPWSAGSVGADHNFPDVANGAFYHDDVEWLLDNDITQGCSATEYCPNDYVTRGQMAAFLHRTAQATGNAGEQHIALHAAAFRPQSSGQQYSRDAWGRLIHQSAGVHSYWAPVHLPQGARVTKLTAWVADDSDTDDVEVRVCEYDLKSGSNGCFNTGPTESSGTPGDVTLEDNSVGMTIDNAENSYVAWVILPGGSTASLSAVQLTYTP